MSIARVEKKKSRRVTALELAVLKSTHDLILLRRWFFLYITQRLKYFFSIKNQYILKFRV